jgi:drug/metabolite transporter (DMT)-like permease
VPIVLALSAAAIWGTADFLGGAASRRIATVQALFVSQAVGLLGMLAVIGLLPGTPNAHDLAWGALGGLLGNAGLYGLYSELAHGTAGVVAPTTAVSAALTPVVVGLAMGERPSLLTLVGVVVALVAVALLAGGESEASEASSARSSRRRSFWVAIASGLGFGGFFVCMAQTSSASGMWPLVSARAVSVAVLMMIPPTWRGLRSVGSDALVRAAGSGVFDVVANACYLIAIQAGTLTVVPVLASLYPASTVILARAVQGQRLGRMHAAGLALALVAVAMVTAGRGG